ncbi:MAG: hypothetical protein E2O68_06330 [Deltaproteobacteria bacterium]|nr:MAG: hypothetical protein E2O68_06330 [Deltaproteobacteria bacterium]
MCFSIEIIRDLKSLAQEFGSKIDKAAFERLNKNHTNDPKTYKIPGADNRIFPNVYSPVIVKGRIIRPMRYRIRPKGHAQEVPGKYNMYNARLDALDKRRTWKTLFGKNHGLVPFKRFFEWVQVEGGKKQLGVFSPIGKDFMWAPCLTDTCSVGGEKLTTFAIITDDPPEEVRAAGHDRCPLFLGQEMIDAWLCPEGKSQKELLELLTHQEPVKYSFLLL